MLEHLEVVGGALFAVFDKLFAGSSVVGAAVGSSGVCAVARGFGAGDDGELSVAGAALGGGAAGCSHPFLLCLPPGPEVALEVVGAGALCEAAAGAVSGRGCCSCVVGGSSPAVGAGEEHAIFGQALEGAEGAGEGGSGAAGEVCGALRGLGGTCVEVPCVVSEGSRGEGIVGGIREPGMKLG